MCLIEFDTLKYTDALFDKFSVPFPQKLLPAVVKRRAEYLSGRYAAQILLKNEGCTITVDTGPDHAPIWPAGWCGSISHTSGNSVAVITPQSTMLTPGVDIEESCPDVMCDTAHVFTTVDEMLYLSNCNIAYESALLITFSAKESLYKALYPKVHKFFGFDAATICYLNVDHQRFCLQLTQALSPTLPMGYSMYGYYIFHGENVITVIA